MRGVRGGLVLLSVVALVWLPMGCGKARAKTPPDPKHLTIKRLPGQQAVPEPEPPPGVKNAVDKNLDPTKGSPLPPQPGP